MEQKYYTIREIAKYFNVAIITVKNWVYSNKLKSVKIAGSRRISKEALKEFESGV